MNLTIKTTALITKLILFNLNICVYAKNPCGNEAGTMPAGFFPVCAGDSLTIATLGANIAQENSALIYILHNSDSADTIGIAFDYNSTGVFYNDGSYPTNLDLFISAYVGPLNVDGSPILTDECADVALPGTPIRFYNPISINHEVYCNVNGCLTVSFSISGGPPDFPGDTLYNYVVQGDYNGIIEEPNEIVSFTRCNTNDYSYNYTIEVFSDGGLNCSASIQSSIFYCHILDFGDTTHVYPGDLNHDGIVNNQDIGLWGLFLYETGPHRTPDHQNTNWNPYPAEDWNRQQLNNEDIKHFDTNGDGVITDDDCQAVTANYGQTWSPATAVEVPESPEESDYQVMLNPIEEIFEGYIIYNVSLERRTGGDLTIKGGYFTIDYSFIQANINFVELGIDNNTWLGERGVDISYQEAHFLTEKKIEVGFTKTNNLSSTGSGVIGDLIISYDANTFRSAQKSFFPEVRVTIIGTHNGDELTIIENEICKVSFDTDYCEPNWTINEHTPFQNVYQSNGTITTDGFLIIGEDQEVNFKADRITLNSGLSVKAGADFKVRIGACAE